MSNELQILPPESAIDVFQCDAVEDIISKIEAEARSIVPDLSTAKGRKAIASTARRVATSKGALDNLGKDLVSEWKSKAKSVDAERRLIRKRLDDLRDEIRQPLTDWENAEEAREQAEREAAELEYDHERALNDNEMHDREQELIRREAEQARIEQERADKEAAEQVEAERVQNEARIAKEAEERAQAEAEAKVKAANDAAEKAKRDKIEAEQRASIQAEIAEDDRKALIERERQRGIQVEADKKAALEKAEADKIEAAALAKQAQIDAAAEEKRLAAERQAKLEADKKHIGKIRGEAKEALMMINGIDEKMARQIILAIAKGKIPHLTINY
jgi:chromosome segregation ATPase